MTTVPTLCATAAIVGVTGVGYGLGRPERDLSSIRQPQKRKQSLERPDRSISSELRSRVAMTSSYGATYSTSFAPAAAVAPKSRSYGRLSFDGRFLSGKVRKLTPDDATQQRRLESERPGSSPNDDGASAVRPRERVSSSRSWIKRLSSNMSSRSVSPVLNAGFPPVTVSQSNEANSMPLNGSTTPMTGSRPSSSYLGPNKLVKRTSSQRLIGDSVPAHLRTLTLRRPATSHRRSAEILCNFNPPGDTSLETSNPEATDSTSQSPETPFRWRQFFTIKVNRQMAIPRKRNSSWGSDVCRRILPDHRDVPTLITAKSVLTSFDIEEIPARSGQSFDFASRPSTAFGFSTLVTPGTVLEPEMTPVEAIPVQADLSPSIEQDESLPRRSFSLHELLSLGPSSRKPGLQRKPSKLIKRLAGRRVHSEPTAAMTITKDSFDADGSSEPRDVADSSMVRKEKDATASQPLRHESVHASAPIDTTPSSPSIFGSEQHSHTPASENYSPNILQRNSFQRQLNRHHPSTSPIINQSPLIAQGSVRHSNYSVAASEQTSTLVGSDYEARGLNFVDDEDTDQGSETQFDSLRTRGTRSTSGARRSRIETIFDESPSPPHKAKDHVMRDVLPDVIQPRFEFMTMKDHHSTIEEEDSIATPVRTIRSDRADDGSPTITRTKPRSSRPLQLASPAEMNTKALSLGTLEYDDDMAEEDDESRWSCFGDDSHMSVSEDWDSFNIEQTSTPVASTKGNSRLLSTSSSTSTTPQADVDGLGSVSRRETRSSIFDWSEQPSDKSPGNRSPPRPRTVHGKKDTDRGSRSVGRRAPSALHARSQSVPVVPDVTGKRETLVTNKFGTWGVGSKGVSEDWNDDFDFEEEGQDGINPAGNREEKRIDSGIVMHIPQTIRDQQAKVVSNISLVREFGLLIEELKQLRIQAFNKGVGSPENSIWQEIDAMIDLADQEEDDPTFPPHVSPPASPSFDMEAFDEQPSEASSAPSKHMSTPLPVAHASKSRRKSVLPTDDVFSTPQSLHHTQASVALGSSPAGPSSIPTRPRKDSEAMARSVIEALQKRKDISNTGLALQPVPSHKKVPFDTTTLRHIVPYVSGLLRKVKDLLPESDEQHEASSASVSEVPPLAQLFNGPSSSGSPSMHRNRRRRSGSIHHDESDDLTKKMTMMNLT